MLIAFVMVSLLALSASAYAGVAAYSDMISPEVGPVTYVETFSDPIEDWQNRWFYLNSNAQNYYMASSEWPFCDPTYRGNQPNGIWLSDDRGCATLREKTPLRINILNGFGADATSFSIDHYTCVYTATFNIYDRDGALVISEPLPEDCNRLSHHAYPLTNGISAFEYATTTFAAEGGTAIDNVTIVVGGTPPSCPQGNATYLSTTGILHIPCVDVDRGTSRYEVDLLKQKSGYIFDLNSATPLP